MKNLLKNLTLAILLMTTVFVQAQPTNIFDPKLPVVWLGMDVTKAKFVGTIIEFGTPEKHKEVIDGWNNVLMMQPDKFNVRNFFKKQTVVPNFASTMASNRTVDFAANITPALDAKYTLTKSDIQKIMDGYDFTNLSGLGLILNVESFDRTKEKATMWVTFVNLNSGEVIFTDRKTSSPGGAGVRNYWVNSALDLMERISKKDWEAWKSGGYVIDPNATVSRKIVEKKVVQRETTTSSVPSATMPTRTPDSDNNEAKVSTTLAASKGVKPGGKYYALLIGISKYSDDRLNLDNPVRDARKVKKVLTEEYNFEPDNAILLEDPTRGEIFSALYKLRESVTTNDNLLIFYAGHGYWDEKIRQGYWWPSDANAADPSNWLSNSDLREQLRGISSAHTLLVSDACFSGGLFRTRDPNMKQATIDYQMLYKMPSRRAITSGTLTAVPDNSVFVEYFLKRLEQNDEQFFPAQQLFNNIRLAIINNSATVPQEGVIAETGDEGGDFIFIKKN